MKTAEEILISFKTSEFKIYSEEEALKAMKLYAEQAVKHHLEKAADNAKIRISVLENYCSKSKSSEILLFKELDTLNKVIKQINNTKIELP